VQIVTIPGGFSFGDDIAAGRVYAAQVERYLRDALLGFVDRGGAILGICNGFQILVKAGILPRCEPTKRMCTITHNEPPRFQDRWVTLQAGREACIFLEPGRRYEMPIAHGEGRVVFARGREGRGACEPERYGAAGTGSEAACGGGARSAPVSGGTAHAKAVSRGTARSAAATLDAECGSTVAVLKYVPPDVPRLDGAPANPNGSEDDIAGLCDETGRVLGLMPHPERFVTWTQHPCWTSLPPREPGDGLAFFTNAVRHYA
jgi:phosphoribosylformylglycinamidine synthase